MSKLWDELVNTAIEIDDRLGKMNIPDAMGHTRKVTINGQNYTIKVTIDKDE